MAGSLINRMLENGGDLDTPAVGMGGTAFYYSDRSAFTVTKIVDETTILAKGDTPVYEPGTGLGGYPASYKEATGLEFTIVKMASGWRIPGRTRTGRMSRAKGTGTPVRLGHRDAYYDPHF